jgi:hypothetical protein
MPDNDSRAGFFPVEHGSDVCREGMHVQIVHRTFAAPYSTRLRPQHAEAIRLQARGDAVIIFGATAQRWQDHDCRAFSLAEGFYLYIPARYEIALYRGACARMRGARCDCRRE